MNRSFAIDLGAILDKPIAWTRFYDGIDIYRIYGDGRSGPSAALLRYAPNACLPPHEHDGYEHIFVLSGSQNDESGAYAAGTMMVNPPGSRHTVRAPEGCLVLALWERPVILLGETPREGGA
jgi:anti-sigma factor ChrR (cupin superfamily)